MTAVNINGAAFRDATPCSLVDTRVANGLTVSVFRVDVIPRILT